MAKVICQRREGDGCFSYLRPQHNLSHTHPERSQGIASMPSAANAKVCYERALLNERATSSSLSCLGSGIIVPWFPNAHFVHALPAYQRGILSLIGSSLLFTIDKTTKPSTIYGIEALVGAGTGLMVQNAYAIVTRKVERHRKPRDIGFINVAQLGSVPMALAIAACVFENKGFAALRNALVKYDLSEATLISALSGAHLALMSGDNPQIAEITIHWVAHTVSRIFGMGIAAGALAICCSLLMDQRKLSTVPLVKG
jgi:hypothetical protein